MPNKTVIKNTLMLYGFSFAKIIFPLLTLPYLTRILSVSTYGVVTYTKSVISYLQLLMDFGFLLSATKDIVEAKQDESRINQIIGSVLIAQGILVVISLSILVVMILFIPMLCGYEYYVLLSYGPVLLSPLLFDYVFRGLERMEVITLRFVVMKGISTFLTFFFVKSNESIIFIPILDIIGSLSAVILVRIELNKLGIKIKWAGLKNGFIKLKESFVYFLSNMATTAFGALNTLIIGFFLSPSDVAFWSVCETLVSGVQTLYNPIMTGIYPEMIKTKDLHFIKHIFKVFMPIISLGCIFTFIVAKPALKIIGGENYVDAAYLLRLLIPVMFFSFPGMVLGWPTLGALGYAKKVTKTTVVTAFFQIVCLGILITSGLFSLKTLAILRGFTEFVLLFGRFYYVQTIKNDFLVGQK